MGSRELSVTALRVLSGWSIGRKADAADVGVLRGHALENETDLPIDELACRIVGRECAKVIQESESNGKRSPGISDIATEHNVDPSGTGTGFDDIVPGA